MNQYQNNRLEVQQIDNDSSKRANLLKHPRFPPNSEHQNSEAADATWLNKGITKNKVSGLQLSSKGCGALLFMVIHVIYKYKNK